jgi:hypothetical protein
MAAEKPFLLPLVVDDTQDSFEWLERAYQQRDGGLGDVKVDPALDSLNGDPRFKAFLKKMKLPE